MEEKTQGEDFALTRLSRRKKDGFTETEIVFTAKRAVKQAGISVQFAFDGHTRGDYIFAPAALYNGNRFYSVERAYAPMYTREDLEMCKKGAVITDVPRLSSDGTSRAQLNTGDLATPCAGVYSECEKRGFLLFWKQKNEAGNFGLTVSEDLDSGKLYFSISAPCVRESVKYAMCTTKAPSDDRGVDFKKGIRSRLRLKNLRFLAKAKQNF